MERRKKALICLFLLVSLIFPRVKIVKAEALPDVEVMESTATIADMVMTYYAESGSAVTNTDWINTLYNDLGTNFGTVEDLAQQGLLVLNENTGYWESTAELATAIENTSAYASLELNQIFNVSAEEAAQLGSGAVAATGGTILGSAAAGVASIGTVPLLGAVTASYWAGIGIGNIIAHKLDLYGEKMLASAPITVFDADYFADNMYSGDRFFYIEKSGQVEVYHMISCDSGVYITGYFWTSNGIKRCNPMICNINNSDAKYRNISADGSYNEYSVSSKNYAAPYYNYGYGEYFNGYKVISIPNVKSSSSEARTTFDNWKNGQNIPSVNNYSPDMIGEDGNLSAEKDQQGNITVPDMLPQVDTSTEAGKPLRLQDWLNFANQANTNTGAGQPDLNKDLFDDILDRIKTLIPVIPDPGPNPDPGGQTRPVPTPTPVPDPDYDVPQPEQPEWQSETTQQTEEVPDSIPTGKPWVVEGLQNKFPFCIPWDIKNMLGKFASASRQAPYIQWRFNPPFTPIDYTFQIDLADFEDAAAILRTLELIAFIVGLAFATRYLIGST